MKTTKIILIILLSSLNISCKIHLNYYYAGIIVDEQGNPIEKVAIKEEFDDEILNKTFSDNQGYFKMKRSERVFIN